MLALPAAQDEGLLNPAESAWLEAHPEIRVRVTPDYQPTEFLDADGTHRGVVADYLALLAERLEVEFLVVTPPGEAEGTAAAEDQPRDEALEPGGGQAHMRGLSVRTERRTEDWLFTEPYLEYPVKILVRKPVANDLSVADLQGLRVAVVSEWAIHEHMQEAHPGVTLEPVRDTRAGLRLLSFGFVDAFLSDLPVATHYMQEDGITNLRVAGDTDYVYRMGMSVRRDLPELHGILEKGLATIGAEERAAIYERWVRFEVAPAWFLNPRLWLGGGATLLALLIVVLVWNRSLKRQVAQRTRDLERELEERVGAEKKRTELERELRQSQRMESLGTVAGGIAHDFNNILLTIYGFSELAQKEIGRPGEEPAQRAREYLEEVLRAADRAKSLVRQILTFSRQVDTELRPVDLGATVKEAMALLRASLPATIEVREVDAGERFVVLGDAAQIHQILLNLGTNAAHAMREEGGKLEVALGPLELSSGEAGRLGVQVDSTGKAVALTVRDTGAGMDPATAERAFDPFFTTKAEGTGLGLSVVHGIVQRHGGAVEVESAPGKGTTFRLVFPLTQDELEPESEPAPAALRGRERVLVVDDEEALVRLVRRHLEEQGYRVLSHTDPEAALEEFLRSPDSFDLLVTDQTMPRMTGLALTREARARRADVPVILVTGYGEALRSEVVEQTGIDALLEKPYSGNELATVVRRVLDRRASTPAEQRPEPAQRGEP